MTVLDTLVVLVLIRIPSANQPVIARMERIVQEK